MIMMMGLKEQEARKSDTQLGKCSGQSLLKWLMHCAARSLKFPANSQNNGERRR